MNTPKMPPDSQWLTHVRERHDRGHSTGDDASARDDLLSHHAILEGLRQVEKGVYEASLEAISISDRRGELVASNRAFADLFGIPVDVAHAGDALPRHAFASPGDTDLVRQTDALILAGALQRCELTHQAESPRCGYLTVCTTKVPLFDRNGNIAGIVATIRRVAEDETTVEGLSTEDAEAAARKIGVMPAKELRVLQMVCQGYFNKQIASALDAPLRTIENRRRRIMNRLHVASLAELVKLIVRLQDAKLIDMMA